MTLKNAKQTKHLLICAQSAEVTRKVEFSAVLLEILNGVKDSLWNSARLQIFLFVGLIEVYLSIKNCIRTCGVMNSFDPWLSPRENCKAFF